MIPYTNKAIMAVLFLIFLPSMSCISIADFMNKSSGSQLIAQVINDWASAGSGGISTNRLAFVIIFLVSLILLIYLSFRGICKGVQKVYQIRNV